MQFSLRSRFRGAFLGAALGQVFAAIALSPSHKASSVLHSAQIWRFSGSDFAAADGGRQAIAQTRSLVKPQLISRELDFSAPSASAIGLLPLILLCHESPEQLQHSLGLQLADSSPPQRAAVSTIAAVLSLMLQEQFLPDRLIPLLVEQGHTPIEQLQQIQSWLTEATPLSLLPAGILSPATAALYSILKTPASFPLALRHSLRLQSDPEAAALVGLLAGTHLSEAGLPIGWRRALDRHQFSLLQSLWGVASTAELLDLADQLWAVWSGVFQPQTWHPAPSTITAVPRLVRPR